MYKVGNDECIDFTIMCVFFIFFIFFFVSDITFYYSKNAWIFFNSNISDSKVNLVGTLGGQKLSSNLIIIINMNINYLLSILKNIKIHKLNAVLDVLPTVFVATV